MNKSQMGFKQFKGLLDSYGISLQGQMVTGLNDVLKVADELGYPAVLKAISSQIIHKTDVGVVFLDLMDGDAVKRAYAQIIKNVEKTGVEEMAGRKTAKKHAYFFFGALEPTRRTIQIHTGG